MHVLHKNVVICFIHDFCKNTVNIQGIILLLREAAVGDLNNALAVDKMCSIAVQGQQTIIPGFHSHRIHGYIFCFLYQQSHGIAAQ